MPCTWNALPKGGVMAVSPWAVYAAAKKHLASGDIDLDSNAFRLALYTSASNALDLVNLSAIGSVTNECDGPPYASQPLVGVTWGVGVAATVGAVTINTGRFERGRPVAGSVFANPGPAQPGGSPRFTGLLFVATFCIL
jgi:hypothetical protein